MNERQTRSLMIDPALREKGWASDRLTGFHWEEEVLVYPGRIGSLGEHTNPGAADYVLLSDNKQLAVIEAKTEDAAFDKGEPQARYYAESLGLRLTYATNGHDVLEIDLKTRQTRKFSIKDFPTPLELQEMLGEDDRSELVRACAAVPFSKAGGKSIRCYQARAVEAVIQALGDGKKRALLNLATGTGKTFIAYQLCHKLIEAKWRNGKPLGEKTPQILFITDRNILANQALDDFDFPANSCCRYTSASDHLPKDRLVYFTLLQTLLGENGDEEKYRQFEPDFFDLVIIDECHRGGRNDESQWRKILDYFSRACHVGLTATPQCDENGATYDYFGKPAYTYSLKRGIEEGFLTQFRLAELKSTLSEYKVTDGDIIDYPEEVNPTTSYTNDQIERKRLEIDERDRHFVDELFERMPLDQKAIIFCVTQAHARRIKNLINDKAWQLAITDDPHYCEDVTADSGVIGEGYLRQFQNNENEIPTILTTSQKLSTGVNARNLRSIVLFRSVNSMVEFKQIIGRGTRTCKGKGYFVIYDFAGAARNFDDPRWDGEPLCPKCGHYPCTCQKPDAPPCPVCGKNPCECPKTCPKCGRPLEHCICEKPPKRTIKIQLSPERTIEAHWEDSVFIDNRRVSVEDFAKDLVSAVKGISSGVDDLRSRWANPESRTEVLEALADMGFTEDRLRDVQRIFDQTGNDILDVLLDLVYDVEPVTRAWRAKSLSGELAKMNPARRAFAEVILDNYVKDGVWSLSRATLTNYIKMKYGTVKDAMRGLDCDSAQGVGELYDDLQEQIYAAL